MTKNGNVKSRIEVCQVAFDESRKGLANQEAALATLRQSATHLGTLAGLAATFLGKEVLSRTKDLPNSSALWISIWCAIAALSLSLLLIADILRPRSWIFHFKPSLILKQFANPDAPVAFDNTLQELAKFNEENYATNDLMLNRLSRQLHFLMATVGLQITCWLIILIRET